MKWQNSDLRKVYSSLSGISKLKGVSAEFARPNNADPYIANDSVSTAIGTALTFAGVLSNSNNSGIIIPRIITNQQTQAYRLNLYTEAPAAIPDNDPYTPSQEKIRKLIHTFYLPLEKQISTDTFSYEPILSKGFSFVTPISLAGLGAYIDQANLEELKIFTGYTTIYGQLWIDSALNPSIAQANLKIELGILEIEATL